MAVTVFYWEMFKGISVGHTSMFVNGNQGNIYVSYWPEKHNVASGFYSDA